MSEPNRQTIGIWMTSALVVGTMIGAGIFLLPVSLAPLGLNAVIGWVISAAGALCIAFALCRLVRQEGGGIQSYVEAIFGPTVGFIVTFAFWVSSWAAMAAVAIATAAALSHETIYRTLFIQARGALKKELLQHLRRTRGMRRSRYHTQKTPDHGRITETVSIRERPAEAEDRAVPGHWEGDLFAATTARSPPWWNGRRAT